MYGLFNGFSVICSLYINHVYVERIDIVAHVRPTITLGVDEKYRYVGLHSGGAVVPTGLAAVELLRSYLGDSVSYQYVLEPMMPSLSEVLYAWGAEPGQCEAMQSIVDYLLQDEFMDGSLDAFYGADDDTAEEIK